MVTVKITDDGPAWLCMECAEGMDYECYTLGNLGPVTCIICGGLVDRADYVDALVWKKAAAVAKTRNPRPV